MDLTRLGLQSVCPLIVDDNAQSLDVLAAMLVGLGMTRITRCASASEARDVLEAQTFDFMLIDYEMPTESGVDLLARVRSDPASANFTTPVILVSATTPKVKVEAARDSGANFLLTKPIAPNVLLDRLRWVARSKRPFINLDCYRGPDRRFHAQPLPEGMEERRASLIGLTQQGERAMSQNEIDSLFS